MSNLELQRITVRLITGKFRRFISDATTQMEELLEMVRTGKFDKSDPKDCTAVELMRGVMEDGRADMLRRMHEKALDLEERANSENTESADLRDITEQVLAMIEEFTTLHDAFSKDQETIRRAVRQHAELN